MRVRRPKKKEVVIEREIIKEPSRKSILDILQTNLKLAKRVSFIHRIIYVGEHRMLDIAESFQIIYKLTNTDYLTEPLSGVLLHYNYYFCCIVEGSEEALAKHIVLLFERENENINNVRFVVTLHHVKSRFCNDWMSYYGRPPERVEDIESITDLEAAYRYTTECCEKLYRFANAFIADQLKLKELKEGRTSTAYDDNPPTTGRARSKSLVERDTYSVHLPEVKLLKFLVQCEYLQTLKHYSSLYEYIGQSVDYRYKTWPAPKNFVPYNVFDEIYDPITDLPAQKGFETKVEETEEAAEVVEENE